MGFKGAHMKNHREVESLSPDSNESVQRATPETPERAERMLLAAAAEVDVAESLEVLAAEFADDVETIAAGRVSFRALVDAMQTLARVRGWRRAWG